MTATDIISLGRLVLGAPGVVLQSDAPAGGGNSGGSGAGPSGLSGIALFAGPAQSNAGYAETQDGAFSALAQAVSFYLQAGGTPTALSTWVNPGDAGTEVSGIGVMEIVTPTNYTEAFLSNVDGADFTLATAETAGLGSGLN